MRRRSPLLVVLALLFVVGIPATTTLARFTSTAVSTGSFAADTLAPPTSVAAGGGATVTLTWVASADAYATGYGIWRSATSGSGYVLVSSVTPGTATTATDSPGAGTWYYVVRTTFASWTSVSQQPGDSGRHGNVDRPSSRASPPRRTRPAPATTTATRRRPANACASE